MPRLPKITVQGWTSDGPAYTIHHPLAGWRNRHARRAGVGGEELVGDHDRLHENPQTTSPAAFMLFAKGDLEVYAFKGGHVYQVTLLVDGDSLDVLVDARDGDRIERYGGDMQLLEQRALEGDELEAALADGAAQGEGVSDAAESQEAAITSLTGAQVEAEPSAPPADGTELSDAQVDDLDTAEDEALEAARDAKLATASDEDEPSTGEMDYDGTVAEFVELVEAFEMRELEGYAAIDSRKGVRDAAAREIDRRNPSPDPED